jgi:hypothetical protein
MRPRPFFSVPEVFEGGPKHLLYTGNELDQP